LVFQNLFNNSFRATERKKTSFRRTEGKGTENDRSQSSFLETVEIRMTEGSEDHLELIFRDNGCGIPALIRKRLYVERCSDLDETDHGLGGVIIRKLLDLNGGTIEIVEPTDHYATVQQIILKAAE
jgi:signal transduction histidine kinase